MLNGRVGINVHLGADLLDWVVNAGFTAIRGDFNWYMIEPQRGHFDWDATDRLVSAARDRHLSLYATLAHAPTWALGDKYYPTDHGPLQNWVEVVARRYQGQVMYYGIDNEPNARLTPGQYLEWWFRPAAETLRLVDAGIHICGPELMTEDTSKGTWEKWLNEFGGLLRNTPLDIITVHSYQKSGREVLRHVVGPQTLWMAILGQQHVREALRRCRLGEKPLWLTETGLSTDDVSEEQQASYYDQILESFPVSGRLEKVFFYQLVDEAARDGNPPVRWGILHEDLSPKPVYHVLQRRLQSAVG